MRRTHLAIAAVVLAVTFLTVGCGSDGDGSDVASAKDGRASATPSLDPDEMGMKFAQCLRDHGIDVDDPEPGKGVALDIKPGTSRSTVDKAMEACRAYDPAEIAGLLAPLLAGNADAVFGMKPNAAPASVPLTRGFAKNW